MGKIFLRNLHVIYGLSFPSIQFGAKTRVSIRNGTVYDRMDSLPGMRRLDCGEGYIQGGRFRNTFRRLVKGLETGLRLAPSQVQGGLGALSSAEDRFNQARFSEDEQSMLVSSGNARKGKGRGGRKTRAETQTPIGRLIINIKENTAEYVSPNGKKRMAKLGEPAIEMLEAAVSDGLTLSRAAALADKYEREAFWKLQES